MKTSIKNTQNGSRKLKKVAKRLAAYSAAAAATVATQGTANATEVVHDVPDVTVGLGESVWFDMAAGTATTSGVLSTYLAQGSFRIIGRWGTFSGSASTWNNPYIYGLNSTGMGFARSTNRDGGLGYFDNGANLSAGAAVGTFANIAPGGYSSYYPSFGRPMDFGDATSWGGDGYTNGPPVEIRGFLGLRFKLGADTHYGWAEVTRAPGDVEFNITLHGFGYNGVPGAVSKAGGYDTADFDNDGDVDGDDFLIWQAGFDVDDRGDTDYDGDTDGDDFLNWQTQLGNTNGGTTVDPPANAVAAPEPSSLLLLAAGAVGFGMWRRRKDH